VRAQQSEEFDKYKIRFDAAWFYAYPSGTMRVQGDTYPVELTKDLSFKTYSTFAGKVNWKFIHKNYFHVVNIPYGVHGRPHSAATSSGMAMPSMPVPSSRASFTPLKSLPAINMTLSAASVVVPELPWFDLFHTYAKIAAAAQITGDGTHQAAVRQ
jgi:hypothetical protein